MSLSPKSTASNLADSRTLSSILVGGVSPAGDLNPHSPDDPQSDSDSFYVLSYLKDDHHHRFTVLFHLMLRTSRNRRAPRLCWPCRSLTRALVLRACIFPGGKRFRS